MLQFSFSYQGPIFSVRFLSIVFIDWEASTLLVVKPVCRQCGSSVLSDRLCRLEVSVLFLMCFLMRNFVRRCSNLWLVCRQCQIIDTMWRSFNERRVRFSWLQCYDPRALSVLTPLHKPDRVYHCLKTNPDQLKPSNWWPHYSGWTLHRHLPKTINLIELSLTFT